MYAARMGEDAKRSLWLCTLLSAAALGLGCGGESGGTSGSTGGPLSGTDSTPKDCTGVIDPVQGLSQACCRKYGIDACGAGLFCAAFDGRKFDTCYPLASRLALEECTEDAHCATGICDATAQLCKSAYGDDCTVQVGCTEGNVCINACPGYQSCVPDCDEPCRLLCRSP